ncbi:hypothetical protein GY45DRAFT_22661 [Cubamyces sp. BRFM 1775]|nr:hypothetical protein GY45DRAFT_22661 [Cubamyces sp. BRFM 1775]
MTSVTPTKDAVFGLTYTPTYSPQTLLVIGLAVIFVLFCSASATLCAYCRRRRIARLQAQAQAPHTVDLERQAHGIDNVKNGSRFLTLPALSTLGRSWSGSSSASGLVDDIEKALPPPALAVAPSSRLRDSVLCKVLCQLTFTAPGKDKNAASRVKDVEAGTADRVPGSASTESLHPDSSLTYPEWVRPHLKEIREQAKREWTLYTPKPALVIPEIVIQCPDDEPVPDSPESVYSCDSSTSSVPDTPPPTTPTLASPVSFYFPASPTFSAGEYLQVPPPSFNAPREEEKPVMRNVSNFSGRTFVLAAAPAPFSKMGKLRERRMAAMQARAQAQAHAQAAAQSQATAQTSTGAIGQDQQAARPPALQIHKGCGTGPRVSPGLTVGVAEAAGSGTTSVGLGLHLRTQLDFQGSLDQALAASGPSGDTGGTNRLSATFSTAGYLDLANILEDYAPADVALPSPASGSDDTGGTGYSTGHGNSNDNGYEDDDNDNSTSDDDERPGRLARLVEAFDSSFSLASIDSGNIKLSDILDGYHYDHFDENFIDEDEDGGQHIATADLVVHDTHARRAVVVYAV